MAEMETTTIVEIDKQIRDLYDKRAQLKKEADQIAVDKVAKLFEGKWICRRDGADEAAYYHISKVEELCDSAYQRQGDPPLFRCKCDRVFAFTYFKGIKTYMEEIGETLRLDQSTKILSGAEMKAILDQFKTKMADDVEAVKNAFT